VIISADAFGIPDTYLFRNCRMAEPVGIKTAPWSTDEYAGRSAQAGPFRRVPEADAVLRRQRERDHRSPRVGEGIVFLILRTLSPEGRGFSKGGRFIEVESSYNRGYQRRSASPGFGAYIYLAVPFALNIS
jgi:hypothetical protein